MTSLTKQAIPKQRIALYGGAFDPVHNAHIEVARAALEQARLDKVVFIPAAQSPLKEHSPVAGDEERLEMLNLAIDGQPHFSVDDSELRRGGVSYSFETVMSFISREPDTELFWVIGADQLTQLDNWHRISELVQLVNFLVLARPGYELFVPNIVGLVWNRINAPLMEESSTLIRERVSNGQSLDGVLPSAVEAFIHENGLYT